MGTKDEEIIQKRAKTVNLDFSYV